MWRWNFGHGKTKGVATFCLAIIVVVVLSSLWRGPADFTAGTSAPLAAAEPTATLVSTMDPAPAPPTHEAAAGPEADDAPPVDLAAATAVPEPPLAPAKVAASGAAQPKRVGIQAGHWKSAELPAELAGLRTSSGTAGGGVGEWQLNRDVAHKVAALLEAEGVVVDVLPATVPVGYKADAFVALHADGSANSALSGYKLARSRRSAMPETDDALLEAISLEYGAATRLRLDAENVTRNMTGYYPFASRGFQHAVAPTTPAVILEMGFMTNRADLRFMLDSQDTVAQGIAQGVLRFLAAD